MRFLQDVFGFLHRFFAFTKQGVDAFNNSLLFLFAAAQQRTELAFQGEPILILWTVDLENLFEIVLKELGVAVLGEFGEGLLESNEVIEALFAAIKVKLSIGLQFWQFVEKGGAAVEDILEVVFLDVG